MQKQPVLCPLWYVLSPLFGGQRPFRYTPRPDRQGLYLAGKRAYFARSFQGTASKRQGCGVSLHGLAGRKEQD